MAAHPLIDPNWNYPLAPPDPVWERLITPPVVDHVEWGNWPKEKIRINFEKYKCYMIVDFNMTHRIRKRCYAHLTDRDFEKLATIKDAQEYYDMVGYLADWWPAQKARRKARYERRMALQ